MEISGYRILKEIGRGGMATVYLAIQESLDREVALKVMSPALAAEKGFSERFLEEARTVAKLTHPNILAVYDVGVVDHSHYIAMEYVGGGELKSKIQAGISHDQIQTILKQIGSALSYAHEEGIVHRDIKPENILFRKNGTAVLSDFGIARAIGSTSKITATGTTLGTPYYMSPEQGKDEAIDGRSDLYSLGVVLYEMLTGVVPYDAGNKIAVVYAHVHDPLPKLPQAAIDFQPVLDRLLAKKPSDRFPDANRLLEALQMPLPAKTVPIAIKKDLPAKKTVRIAPPRKSADLKRVLGGSVLALALAIMGLFFLFGEQKPSPVKPEPPAAPPYQTETAVQPHEVQPPAPETTEQAIPPGAHTDPETIPPDQATQKPNSGSIIVHSQPAGARIILDGTPRGISPLTISGITAGRHTVKADKASFFQKTVPLEIRGGQTLKLDIALTRMPPTRLYINTTPSVATIKILNVETVFRQGIELPPGNYHVVVSAPNFAPYQEWIVLNGQPEKQLAVSLSTNLAVIPISNSLGMEFVFIKPGSFIMGSPSGEDKRDDDETRHRVTITKGFYLQTTEVTQGQWQAVMGRNPSHFKNCGVKCPVEEVSWEDAQQFIGRLNQREEENNYRLPTEAEWEYACRAGRDTPFSVGICLSGQANYNGNFPLADCARAADRKQTLPVGSFQPNAWGLYDMHGNVWEWCHDWYDVYPSKKTSNPRGPENGSFRICRGGGWNYGAEYCRSANRHGSSPGLGMNYLGFRLVKK
jgi:serine/threonine-protein kinase PpkA